MMYHAVRFAGVNSVLQPDALRAASRNDAMYTVICFAHPCYIKTPTRVETAQAGDCYVRSPGNVECEITRKDGGGITADWVCVDSAALGDFLAQVNLPADTVLHIGQSDHLRNYISHIIWEKEERAMFYEIKIRIIIESMLLYLSRTYHIFTNTMLHKYGSQMKILRNEVRMDLSKPWPVGEMAKRVGLSESRFTVLYKQFFNNSPTNDLIRMRIEKSRILLQSTDMPLQSIARECGFRNEFYFSKVFKRISGQTPGKFRSDARN